MKRVNATFLSENVGDVAMVGMRMIEIWRLKPEPRKVASVGEELFYEYLRKREELLKNDLGTDWLGRMLAALLKNTVKGATESITVTDVTGASRVPNAKSNVYASIINSTYNYDAGCYIGVGTGTTLPAKSDYKLASEVARSPASATYTDGSSIVSVYASFTLTSDTDIWEVGLYWKDGYNGWIWLLDRTVLSSAVRFPANTPMLVSYNFAI
jgi:hypothetical protein